MDASEGEILERAKRGDREAFSRALLPYLPTLLAYTRTICGDHHIAQDVVQATALIAWQKLSYLFPEVDFGTWLKGIARREALSERRKSLRLRPAVEALLEAAFDDPSPDALASEREALKDCLKRLSGASAGIVEDHYFRGEKLVDIARVRSRNFNTVRALLFRAREALKDCVRARLAMEGR